MQKKKLINKVQGSFLKGQFLGTLLWLVLSPEFMAQDLPMILSSKTETTETGLRIEFQFSSHVERADVSSWIEQKNWFILNFYNLIRPSPNFFQNLSSYPIQDIQQNWSQNSLQLSIQISRSIGMFDVILDDKNSTIIIVLTFQDYVEEKELNPSYVFPNPKDAQKKAHPTSWKDARERTTLEILCDTKGLPIYVDGHLVGYSPLKNPIDVLPGWHKVGYFPNDFTQDNNALTSKEKIMNDILVMGRLDVYVDEGAHETIALNYQTLGEEVVDYNKRFQAGSWIGFSLFFMTILLMSWGLA